MTTQERQQSIDKIRRLPGQIEALVSGLSAAQLTTHFLTGEWTVAQNVHHLADSHMNSYIRCKLILTEENPPLKPYDQDAWANLPDAQTADLSTSLTLLKQLHARWVTFWENLPETAWGRVGFHPDNGPMTLADIVRGYAAHGEAHIDQITRTLAAKHNNG
ncbi:MAG: YfiT family bacillithiol transferase [Caldilineaceae bacterium]